MSKKMEALELVYWLNAGIMTRFNKDIAKDEFVSERQVRLVRSTCKDYLAILRDDCEDAERQAVPFAEYLSFWLDISQEDACVVATTYKEYARFARDRKEKDHESADNA